MAEAWAVSALETLYSEPSRNGLTRPKRVRGSGYKMVNMGELFAYDRIRDQEMELVPLSADEIRRFGLQQGDLLFARQSLVAAGTGKCSIVDSLPDVTVFESHLIRVRLDREGAEPRFYFYYFSSPQGKGNIQSLVMQVSAAGIRASELARLHVPVPPLPVQCKIAAVLSAYDDLIENNLRRIEILEEMAQAIYREWFVHFRFPGHEQVPMVDGLPEGWETRRLGDLASQARRSVNPTEVEPETPYVGLEHIPRKSIALSEWGRAADVQSTKFVFRRGEILFGKIRPYFHKVAVAPVDGVCSSDAIVIVAEHQRWSGLVLGCVSSEDFVAHATQTSNGTKMPRANWDVLVEYPVHVPTDPLLDAFSEVVDSVVAQVQNLVMRNRNLRATRDLLLPKLVSGDLDISELDIEVPDP